MGSPQKEKLEENPCECCCIWPKALFPFPPWEPICSLLWDANPLEQQAEELPSHLELIWYPKISYCASSWGEEASWICHLIGTRAVKEFSCPTHFMFVICAKN